MIRRLISCLALVFFCFNLIAFPDFNICAQLLPGLPAPGEPLTLTARFQPPTLLGMTLHPENPLLFDFLVDRGEDLIRDQPLKVESEKLIKYFLAAMTIPDKDSWVNLSPYEKDRIMPDPLAGTDMGKAMLEQDYLLKQLSASLTNPEKELGKKFWDEVKKRAQKEFNTLNIPLSTFNKVWIVPEKALVLEHEGYVLVGESRLKVMLDEDYEALASNVERPRMNGSRSAFDISRSTINSISSQVFREMILPQLEKEINEGKTFAPVRQIYNAVILATWYKKNLKDSLLGHVYVDQSKIAGVDIPEKDIKEKVYRQYLEAFRKGVYSMIKEDADSTTQDALPRKYFSGGVTMLVPEIGLASSSLVGKKFSELADAGRIVNVEDLNFENKAAAASAVKGAPPPPALSDFMQKAIEESANTIGRNFKVTPFLSEEDFGRDEDKDELERAKRDTPKILWTAVKAILKKSITAEYYPYSPVQGRKFMIDITEWALSSRDVIEAGEFVLTASKTEDEMKLNMVKKVLTKFGFTERTREKEHGFALSDADIASGRIPDVSMLQYQIRSAVSSLWKIYRIERAKEAVKNAFGQLPVPKQGVGTLAATRIPNQLVPAAAKVVLEAVVLRISEEINIQRRKLLDRIRKDQDDILKGDNVLRWDSEEKDLQRRFVQQRLEKLMEMLDLLDEYLDSEMPKVGSFVFGKPSRMAVFQYLGINFEEEGPARRAHFKYIDEGDALNKLTQAVYEMSGFIKPLSFLHTRGNITYINRKASVSSPSTSSGRRPSASSGVGENLVPAPTVDFTKGGIDFDPALFDLQIKRDAKGVPLPLLQQNLEQINIEGLYPVILNITPVNAGSLPLILGKTAPQNTPAEVKLTPL